MGQASGSPLLGVIKIFVITQNFFRFLNVLYDQISQFISSKLET